MVALVALVKGADWLIAGAEEIGVSIGFSPFVVGVTIVALGTSLPELVAGIGAILQNAPEIVVANAIGSNVANILLIVGVSVVVGKKMVVEKNLIDLDLPLVAASTLLFASLAWDGDINRIEALILLIGCVSYVGYILRHKDESDLAQQAEALVHEEIEKRPRVSAMNYFLVLAGIVALALGAHYLIQSVLELSALFGITAGVITITAVALGTSLPELFVSVKATLDGKSETALGNIFGSNVFNLLVVVGVPGLFATLPLEPNVLLIGLPALLGATFLFVVSGISGRIHAWEGAFYLAMYVVFTAKLFEMF